MYIFRTDIPIKVKQIEACKIIGLTQRTLSKILNGKVACRKVVAFSITKYIDETAEINDFFYKKGEGPHRRGVLLLLYAGEPISFHASIAPTFMISAYCLLGSVLMVGLALGQCVVYHLLIALDDEV